MDSSFIKFGKRLHSNEKNTVSCKNWTYCTTHGDVLYQLKVLEIVSKLDRKCICLTVTVRTVASGVG